MSTAVGVLVLVAIAAVGIAWRPSRKAFGLTLFVAGAILSFTLAGAVAGVPAMIVGGLMMFM